AAAVHVSGWRRAGRLRVAATRAVAAADGCFVGGLDRPPAQPDRHAVAVGGRVVLLHRGVAGAVLHGADGRVAPARVGRALRPPDGLAESRALRRRPGRLPRRVPARLGVAGSLLPGRRPGADRRFREVEPAAGAPPGLRLRLRAGVPARDARLAPDRRDAWPP